MISSGILLFAAFVLLRLFTHNKPSMTATDTTSRSRRETVTPAATGAVIEPCTLTVSEGVLTVVVVGGRDELVTVAATDELKINVLLSPVVGKGWTEECCSHQCRYTCRHCKTTKACES